MDEDSQQRITYLLQEIDANICAAHRSATQICGTVRRHHQILRQIHEASRVWRPLFDSFTQKPAARRVTRTPSRFSRPLTPGSTRVTIATQRQQHELERVDDEDVEDDSSFISREETFKTTTLKKHQPPSSGRRNTSADEDSLDVSTNSDNLPRMSRTPYMSKSAVQSGAMTQESTSTLSSSDRRRWSPRMTSPPRTGIISGDQPDTAHAGPRQISTPPSAISSVEYDSPGISRNLMKMGAFEYTPPRDKKSRSGGEQKEADETNGSIDTPHVPKFSTVRLSTAIENEPATTADDNRRTPVYPKTLYPAKATSPFKSPSLRRKYSSRSNVSSRAIEEHRRRRPHHDNAPEFDLASPLLRTQLKAMTPNTPLSNRLVGASLDVGSVSQEARLLDYDDSFTAGEPTPKFELSLLPAVFQSVDQLAEMLPDYGKEKIEILLDTLVSRRLLRPFVVEGTMFWQKPL
ncbi:DASH complex subunit Ask1 [Phytophthora cactorum]|nr:DASH complex subunit Ask1 [Phytophthora cactorum]